MTGLARDWLLDPLALLFLLSLAFGVAAVFGGRRRRGVAVRRAALLLLWSGCFLTASAPAIVNPLVAAHEARHPAPGDCAPGTPVVVLGGGVDSRIERAGEYERMRPATLARVAAAERIARAEPDVTLVLSGGGLRGDRSRVAEAEVMAGFLVERGVGPGGRKGGGADTGRTDSVSLLLDVRSGDTAGNAREALAILAADDPAAGDRPATVRLLTSALHMPRALATFRSAGLDACAVPVDPIALPDVPPWALMPQTTALVKFDALVHELAALAVYRLRGDL